jgi:hypothetical protein
MAERLERRCNKGAKRSGFVGRLTERFQGMVARVRTSAQSFSSEEEFGIGVLSGGCLCSLLFRASSKRVSSATAIGGALIGSVGFLALFARSSSVAREKKSQRPASAPTFRERIALKLMREQHSLLLSLATALPVKTVVTTNYDELIEQASEAVNIRDDWYASFVRSDGVSGSAYTGKKPKPYRRRDVLREGDVFGTLKNTRSEAEAVYLPWTRGGANTAAGPNYSKLVPPPSSQTKKAEPGDRAATNTSPSCPTSQ